MLSEPLLTLWGFHNSQRGWEVALGEVAIPLGDRGADSSAR
jgi:hypothetical protein